MPEGSGAIEIHRRLSEYMERYVVRPFDPRREYFPPALLALRNSRARIVHATPDHGGLLAYGSQPLVITFHNFVLDREMACHATPVQRLHYRTDLRWLTRLALKRATIVTAVSKFTAGKVRAFFSDSPPVHVIANGIDTTCFVPAQRQSRQGNFRVLVSGNASRRKGTHLLGRIASHLDPGIEIVCTLSDGELLRWAGPGTNMRALGRVAPAQMPAVYQESDVLLMPTAREGFGLAVAEAMSSGLPVVASDTSTMPELIVDGQGGYLCSLDEPEQFAARINGLARSAATARRMGEFNRKRAEERFTLKRMIDGYQEVFDEVERRTSFKSSM